MEATQDPQRRACYCGMRLADAGMMSLTVIIVVMVVAEVSEGSILLCLGNFKL